MDDRPTRARRPGISRRRLLQASLAAGGSAAALAAWPGAASAKGPRPGPTVGTTPGGDPSEASGLQLFSDSALNFQTLFALGAAGYGISEVGEVLVTANEVTARGASYQTFSDAFSELADTVADRGTDALANGHTATARASFARAAEYGAQALFFVLGTDTPEREPDLFATMKGRFEKAISLSDPPIEPVAIPYERTTMPGYFLRPGASGKRRPTVILNNGSDGQSIELLGYGGAAAVERGYNALIFEGPGQGTMLFERQIPFRPDWEKVITPVVDWLVKRTDVDTSRIALTGWSMGGELVMRAAAFEPRLAAVVADPGCVSVWDAWPSALKKIADSGDAATVNQIWESAIVPGATPAEKFDLQKRGEIFTLNALQSARAGNVATNFYELAKTIQQFDCADVVKRIKAPVLVTSYELEQFFPGQAQQLYALLRGPKQITNFTVAEGAQFHDAPMAPQFRNEVVFDWLDETLSKH